MHGKNQKKTLAYKIHSLHCLYNNTQRIGNEQDKQDKWDNDDFIALAETWLEYKVWTCQTLHWNRQIQL